MDRNTVTGLVLILVVMVAWAYFTMPSEQELQQRQAEQARQDSIAAAQAEQQDQAGQDEVETMESPSGTQTLGQEEEEVAADMGMFSAASISDTTETIVETPLYRATFTNVGAGPSKIVLRDYETWNHRPVQMINDTTQSAYSLGFLTTENYNVETENLLFEPLTNSGQVTVEEGGSGELSYALNVGEDQRLVYTYTFYPDKYEIDLEVRFENLNQNIIGGAVDFGWQPGLNITEKNISDEAGYASAYVFTGGEMEQLSLSEAGRNEQNYNGTIDWVSTRTKFFAQIIETDNPTDGALLIGEQTGATENPNTNHQYQSYITTDLDQEGSASFRMYVGPLAYNSLTAYDEQAYDMVDIGYSWLRWMSDPIVKYIVIPFFGFAGSHMNYGLAIVLFALLVKLVLYPLTKKSYESMAAMKELQPQMAEIKEKFEDDPQKQQKETMKLYKEAGVNPLGGCLPNLLQLPILVTLWYFFRNSILIRQESFLWANDLSAPDYILSLPFEVPFLGDQIAGFVLLMTAAMFLQSKLTGGMGPGGGGGGAAGGPNMKALQYVFPFMLLFIFNNFAAGLSLYYFIYNLVSIVQQLIIYKGMEDSEEEPAKATAKA